MLSIEEIKRKKQEYKMTNAQLAKLSGVPLGTVQKVLGNVTRSPQLNTMKALSEVFEDKKYNGVKYSSESHSSHLHEPVPQYAVSNRSTAWNTNYYDRQGTYTIEDYMALPDEQRVELIDGVIYDMSAPTAYHQLIGGEIYAEIRNFIKANKGNCVPFIAPTDVQLDCDNRTMVQPDVMIVCDRDKINHKRIFGAPDFIAEVLSPSTKNKDIMIKGAKYQQAGVREYWLIDPAEKNVLVFDFRSELKMKMYTFEDKIPVLIYDGKLVIDMKEINDYLSFADE